MNDYVSKTLPISTSRGCLYRCVFCNEAPAWGRFRIRSAQNVYGEITHQLEMHPEIENFFFNDSLINGDINMLDELADLIDKNRLKIRWGGQGRIKEEMTFEFLKKLYRAGFSHVSYGLESGSQIILKEIKKNVSLETAEEVIRNTHKLGIYTSINIIVGFPTETEKELLATAEFLERNIDFIDAIYFHPLALMPNSSLYNYKDRFGIKLPEVNSVNLWYTSDGNNNYKIRLERIEFFKKILKDKFVSNISMFNYYLVVGNQYYEEKNLNKALEYYLKAKASTKDINKISIIEDKIESCKISD